ncbi:helix-turn-helix transcriptional regulator [Nonomuraea soli]|uniref:DNA-binding CsgD family transcriptional regulator/DNA-binding transcriptional ArsR family regulator n=1 Tax=Nonomuraea soli TaxID=1032476 RepID=A0A7W0CP63_9ACTN|nr:helix-turn-helix transcriptional regulator [Nonomuraea soli]MBA2894793.1 DNA-binding CsgD family transcriptional regulator/DNA-binding transcriptional ArsR family regulator [Nonomuraea soli]
MNDQPLLAAVGVSGFDERVYRLLLRQPGRRAAELAAVLEVGAPRVRAALARLDGNGLVRRVRSGVYEAVRPEGALASLVSMRRMEAEARLAEVIKGAGELALLYDSGRMGASGAPGVVEVLSDPQAVRRELMEQNAMASSEVLYLDTPPYVARPEGYGDSNAVEEANTREFLARGVDLRVIYCPASFHRPGRLETLLRLAQEGERSRMLPHVPFKLRVTDRRAAMLPLMDGVYDHIAVLRPSRLLDALIELFELYWERAQPLAGRQAPPDDGPSEEEQVVLRLLKSGLKDEAIGRQLGVSTRTATRKIAAVMERLGATTRFQAGLEAAARGWL